MSSNTIACFVVEINGIFPITRAIDTWKIQPLEAIVPIFVVHINVCRKYLSSTENFNICSIHCVTTHTRLAEIFGTIAGIFAVVRTDVVDVITHKLPDFQVTSSQPVTAMDRPLNRQFPSPLILVTHDFLVPNFSPTWECGILVLCIMRDTLSQTAFLCVRTRGRNVKSSPDCSTLSTVISLSLVSFPSGVMSGSSLTFMICSKKSSFRIFWAKHCAVFLSFC